MLSLAVETCTADHLDTKAMCSLLQVSTACRKALQGSRGQQRVSINPTGAAVAGFTAWLAKWAGLVAEGAPAAASTQKRSSHTHLP